MRRALAVLGIAAVLALSGCAAKDGYPDATAQSMQQAVLGVSQASSVGDWGAAQLALTDAEARLAAAVAAGEISEERAAMITAAIAEVRADLDALIAAQLEETEQDNGNGNGKPEKPEKPPKEDKDKDKDNEDD